MMKRAGIVNTALMLLVVGSGTVAHAQGDPRKKPDEGGHGAPDQQRQQDQRGQDQQRQQQEQQRQQQQQRVSAEEQRQRVAQQQQRDVQYQQHLERQVPVVQQQTERLQQDQRMAQYRVQQQYAAQLRQQQEEQRQRLQTQRNYSADPYTTTPHSYRYVVNGTARQTNQYGVDVLRQAVNNGYAQGYRAGEADRVDRRRANYRSSIGYQDANYGYGGNYVDRTDYNYYFRQGFQRGYDDGYGSRARYGTYTNGNGSILSSLLTSILGLAPIR